ncbi:MAG TPA: acyltransferase domain-containing protein [Solirubrobacterales bacterium]|nr:acyltransferase domain-containing protein [Solirubrobacterales bacterium]
MGTSAALRLVPLAASDAAALSALARELAERAAEAPADLQRLERLARERLPRRAELRAAVLAADGEELRQGLEEAIDAVGARLAVGRRFAVGYGAGHRVAFLFPGQGAPARIGPGAVGAWVPAARGPFAVAGLLDGEPVPDDLVQLSVVAACLGGLAAARELGIVAELAVGHSLGELVALHWAGACDEPTLLQLARARGSAMTAHADRRGTMAALRCDAAQVEGLAAETGVAVACRNSPRSCVVSGDASAVEDLLAAAKRAGLAAMPLPVVGAFHSPLMRPAQPVFAARLAGADLSPPQKPVFSTITGGRLDPAIDLRRLLLDQLVDPVLFADALAAAAAEADLLLDLGPGRILAPLVAEITEKPLVSMRVGDPRPRGLLEVAAAAFAAGATRAGGLTMPAPEAVAS